MTALPKSDKPAARQEESLSFTRRAILQLFLFAPGPFYCYPWKPFINALYGDNYETGLKHFRVGHYGLVNNALHGCCLLIQVMGNFAFLNRLDALIPQPVNEVGLLSLSMAASWSLSLLASPAPKLVSLLSTAVIVLGYHFSPAVTVENYEFYSVAGLIGSYVAANAAAAGSTPRKKTPPAVKSVFFIAGFVLWYLFWKHARDNYWGSLAPAHSRTIYLIAVAFYTLMAVKKNPLKPIVVIGTLLSKVLAIASGSELLWFHGAAFFASLCQGVSHAITREEATLIALERKGEEAKIRYEYAHVTFFPNIFLHTVRDLVFGSK